MVGRTNHHATVLVLGDKGILIEGESGSGKTALALSLLRHGRAAELFACLVSDDQVFLDVCGDRILAEAPPSIAGLAEARGYGPGAVSFEREAVIDLVLSLAEPGMAPRYPEGGEARLLGIPVRRLVLPAREETVATHAVLAALALPPFH